MIKLTSINIPLEVIFNSNAFILLGIREVKEYVNDKATDKVIGYSYQVVDIETFEKFSIKVLGTIPIISQETIDSSTKKIKVTFDNAFAKPYRTASGSYELSIKADSVNIVTS